MKFLDITNIFSMFKLLNVSTSQICPTLPQLLPSTEVLLHFHQRATTTNSPTNTFDQQSISQMKHMKQKHFISFKALQRITSDCSSQNLLLFATLTQRNIQPSKVPKSLIAGTDYKWKS